VRDTLHPVGEYAIISRTVLVRVGLPYICLLLRDVWLKGLTDPGNLAKHQSHLRDDEVPGVSTGGHELLRSRSIGLKEADLALR
jgi:hypothetical protein